MSTTCKYCNEPENKQENPGLICESCICFVHLACTRRPGTPGDFACDVFFDFTCEDCSSDNKEQFKRNKFPWVSVIILTLHHLSKHSLGISNHGFFHYKTHICSFVDRNWNLLFGSHCKQKKNWIGTIAGALSVYNNLLFRSGSVALGETGWWKLLHKFSPAVAAHIVQELGRDKNKSRVRSHMALDKTLFIYKIIEMGYKSYISQDMDMSLPANEPPAKRKRLESNSLSALSSSSFLLDTLESDTRGDMLEDSIFDDAAVVSLSDADPVRFTVSTHMPSDSSSIHSLHQSIMFEDSDTRSASPLHPTEQSDTELKKPDSKPKKHPEKPRRETLFSSQLNSVDLPWLDNKREKKEDIVEMTQYQEIQLLKQVEGMIVKVGDPKKKAELYMLKAKLGLRRLKRHKHLPLFDLDKTVKLLAGYVTEDPNAANSTERVLDRFQRTYLLDNLCGTISRPHWGPQLVAGAAGSFRSPYSGATLKPYIRRDTCAEPLWTKITQELLIKTHRHIPGYKPPAPASLDYSYVRPHHVAAVNALCAQFFWPGVDLTEALQYPEFSCVVTYKRIVVACAFLVPDVGPNQAYISFIVTRPEWRNAKIASFMLYHLLQTCTGKDVTLHVSPTNPAIFLYQKFGFKVEELVQDFYEKYYDIDYKGCRHALFLRLVR